MKDYLDKFMLESNQIEGEHRINPGDIDAVVTVMDFGISTVEDILELHEMLGGYLNKMWVGSFRKVNVRVGSYRPPNWTKVPKLMEKYMKKFSKMNSWTAHNEFEKIHPFQDLNGRVGRIIWLIKAVEEGYNFRIPFLQMYYYQTLTEYEK